MKYNFLNKLNSKDLNELRSIISNPSKVGEMIFELDNLMELKANANNMITIEETWFSPESYSILANNGIFTAEDLVNCDVHSLKGIGVITGEEISWGKKFYDFSNVNADEKESKKLIK